MNVSLLHIVPPPLQVDDVPVSFHFLPWEKLFQLLTNPGLYHFLNLIIRSEPCDRVEPRYNEGVMIIWGCTGDEEDFQASAVALSSLACVGDIDGRSDRA